MLDYRLYHYAWLCLSHSSLSPVPSSFCNFTITSRNELNCVGFSPLPSLYSEIPQHTGPSCLSHFTLHNWFWDSLSSFCWHFVCLYPPAASFCMDILWFVCPSITWPLPVMLMVCQRSSQVFSWPLPPPAGIVFTPPCFLSRGSAGGYLWFTAHGRSQCDILVSSISALNAAYSNCHSLKKEPVCFLWLIRLSLSFSAVSFWCVYKYVSSHFAHSALCSMKLRFRSKYCF